jgi:predicted dinucleotide-binding enzyme
MNYAIIGFGRIGHALARAFARNGIEVSVATTRDPESFASDAAAIDVSGSIAVTRTLDLTADVSNVLNATIFSPPFLPETAYDNEWMGRTIRIGLLYRFK